MKLTIAFAALATVVRAQVSIPSQTYFVPMPEKTTLTVTFDKIRSVATTPIIGYIGIAVDTAGTVIWYDHWEDGRFEDFADLEKGIGLHESTEIWGDGDCSNGVAPDTDCTSTSSSCTCDVLTSGQSIVLKAVIENNNSQELDDSARWDSTNPFKGFYDGGDKIVASFPIAVTRGVHPTISGNKGSYMAGAVEVLETREWGTEFTAPVGYTTSTDSDWSVKDSNDGLTNDGFEHVVFYVQAGEEGTDLEFSDGTTKTIGAGETFTHPINDRGETLSTNKPVQVDLITGDVESSYELRWYSLLPTAQWSSRYISPVGDSTGKTRAIFYNPNSNTIKVKGLYKSGSKSSTSVTIDAGQHVMSEFTPDGTGAEFYSEGGEPFFAMSFTDTVGKQQIFDWGFPIVPKDRLSSQALIGWGYGCTGNDCKNDEYSNGDYSQSRSVVWVTPTENADIYIDRDNSGDNLERKSLSKLECLKIVDDDNDMSGARIWAVERNAGPESSSLVDIAVAWGQDPANSGTSDSEALDMGTVVPPFYTLRASETVTLTDDRDGNGKISPGDICTYRTVVQNVGNREYAAGDYKFVEPAILTNLPGPRQTLVSESGRFIYGDYSVGVSDDKLTRSSGYKCSKPLPARGGQHLLTFEVLIGDPEDVDIAEISNAYIVEDTNMGIDLPVSAKEVIYLDPSVDIQKTVFLGHVSCNTDGVELITAAPGTDVTYCYKATNTGTTYLKDVAVTDTGVGYGRDNSFALLAPGDVEYASEFQTAIDGDKATDATVTGIPVLVNGDDIGTYTGGPLTDTDPAGVKEVAYIEVFPSIKLWKTVRLGGEDDAGCSNSETSETAKGTTSDTFTYCYKIRNKGDTHLKNVRITDPEVGMDGYLVPGIVSPKSNKYFRYAKIIPSGGERYDGKVKGEPVQSDGQSIPGYNGDSVTDTDPAGVEEIVPGITIEKTVFLGDDFGSCDGSSELVIGTTSDTITYCYMVKNTGSTHLKNVQVTDPQVSMPPYDVTGIVAPNKVKFIKFDKEIPDGGENFVAKVQGDAATSNGDLLNADTVTDTDGAAVEEIEPSITIKKTVYLGPEYGSCNDGSELVHGTTDDKITYCYKVINTGDTPLVNVEVTDPLVGMLKKTVPGVLNPNEEKWFKYEKTIPVNGEDKTAKVEGDPADSNGNRIPTCDPVTDTDDAAVQEIGPAIKIEKTVYLGDESGSCDKGSELVIGTTEDKCTYCYKVTNTGDTHLKNVEVTDPQVGMSKKTVSGVLAPLGVKWFKYDKNIPVNGEDKTAKVEGDPADSSGSLLGVDPVTDTDNAAVEEISPSIVIEKTVFFGDDSGSCDGSSELVVGTTGDVITYCYKVTNTGDAYLKNVKITDPEVAFPPHTVPCVLAPGGTKWVKFDKNIPVDGEKEFAKAEGDPATSTGIILGISPVTATDDAAVEEIAPAITIVKTVYLGDESGDCSSGVELIQGINSDDCTYCYKVINTGDTHLTDIEVTDREVDMPPKTLPGVLAPNGEAWVKFSKPIDGDEKETATAEGAPATPEGDTIPNCGTVTDTDDAAVEEVEPEIILVATINIEKTVHLGDINPCFDGTELQYGHKNEVVTYCFKVTNTGEIDLKDVKVTDLSTGVTRAGLGSLLVGKSKYTRIVDTITGSLNSAAEVEGTPIDNGEKVFDSDPAGVEEIPVRVCVE